MKTRIRSLLAAGILVAGLFCITGLNRTPLERWDEQTNRDVVRDLRRRPSPFLTLNGQPFFEKPPLWYLLSAATVTVMPAETAGLRIVSAISGWLIIATLAFVLNRLISPAAALTGIAVWLGTGQLFRTNAGNVFASHHIRSADVDMLQLLLLLWAGIAALAVPRTRHPYRYAAVSGFFLGLAILTKGPLAVAIGIVLFGLLLPYNGRAALIVLIGAGITAAPWYIAMWMRYGSDFISSHIGYHILDRTREALEGHDEPWWFYVRLLADPTVFPLGLLIPAAALEGWRRRKKLPLPLRTCWLLFIGILVLITAVRTRLAWYLLPVYPVLTVILPWWLVEQWGKPRSAVRLIVLAGCAGLVSYGITRNFLEIFHP